jgi:hypothetical protein
MLAVADPDFAGDPWLDAAHAPSETVVTTPDPEPDTTPPNETKTVTKTKNSKRFWHDPKWGGIFFGTAITPLNPAGRIQLSPKRVSSDQFRGCLAPFEDQACSALRGFDMRWQYFHAGQRDPYPRYLWYFRTGYHSGWADFSAEDSAVGFESGDATSLGYFTVPLFLGGNVYLFDEFPVRPYAGLGFGLDVLRVEYARHQTNRLKNASARIGFELHAGIEARITNHVALMAEVQQLWSARKKLDGVPDFSNTGVTIITGVAIGFRLPDSQAKSSR